MSRTCGECTLCCTLVRVDEINKPAFTACPSICATGCSRQTTKPASCTAYSCFWLMGYGADTDRPDRIGAVGTPIQWLNTFEAIQVNAVSLGAAVLYLRWFWRSEPMRKVIIGLVVVAGLPEKMMLSPMLSPREQLQIYAKVREVAARLGIK